MRTFRGIAELTAALGTHLGYSRWHTVTQEQINLFADATGDRQWIHVDPEAALEGPFGATIAHGYLTLSLIPVLAWQVYSIEGAVMSVNYGADKLRFPTPVPTNSRVRAGVELRSVDARGADHQVVTRVTVECEGSTKPACVVDTISIVRFA